MAEAQFLDSFDDRTTTDLLIRYPLYVSDPDFVPTITSSAGRNGTNGIRITRSAGTSSGGLSIGVTVPTAARYTFAFARRWSTLPPATHYRPIASFRDSGTSQCELRLYADGTLRMFRGTTQITGAISSSLIVANVMNHFELQVTCHNTTGAAELRLNGTVVAFAVTNVNTRNGTNNQINEVLFRCDNSSTSGDVSFVDDSDDWMIHDSATFAGDCRVGLLRPDGAGTYSEWTPTGAATLWEAVDDTTPDGDSTFSSSASIGQKETFSFQNLPPSAVIKYVQDVWNIKKTDAGTRTLAPRIKSGATEQLGTNLSPTTSYSFFAQMNNLDPATGVTWTAAGFNNAERGEETTG